jgi:hypothetical protein
VTVRSLNIIRSRSARQALHRVLEIRNRVREIHVLARLDDDNWRYVASSIPNTGDLLAANAMLRLYIEEHIRDGMDSIVDEEEL